MREPRAAAILAAIASDPRLRCYLRAGRISTIPAKLSRRMLLLNEVAQAFEPGVRYPERELNRVLAGFHPDHASLRRYLVDAELMARAGGFYWRIGGPVR